MTQRLGGMIASAMFMLIVSGCATGSPSAPVESAAPSSEPPSPSLQASVQPSGSVACAEPTVVGSPSQSPALSFLPAGSRARVVADSLCLRELPNAASAATMTLSEGSEVMIGGTFDQWGPVVEGDTAWYPIQPGEPGYGWVAGERDGSRYLELIPFDCPTEVDPTTALPMTPWERLTCYGGQPAEVIGVIEIACQGGARVGKYEPEWLARWCYPAQVTNRTAPTVEPTARMQLVFSPSLGVLPEVGMVVRLVGHFDDPAAATCAVIPSTDIEWSQPAVQLLCREQFVVTEFEVLDHMDLPPGA